VLILEKFYNDPGDGSSTDEPMIDKLEFLIALAREKNFGKAAEQCGVT